MMKRLTIISLAMAMFSTTAVAGAEDSSASSLVSSYQELIALLKRDGVAHQPDDENQFVSIPTEKGPIDGMLGIRWDDERNVIHFIQPITLKLPEGHLPIVEAAITRINHGLPFPGLGMNHETQVPYFRMSVPIDVRGGLSDAEVRSYFSRTLTAAAKWQPMLQSFVDGSRVEEKVVEQGGSQRIPTGKYQSQFGGSEWTLQFDSTGSVKLLRDSTEVVDSRFEIREQMIRFTDRGGPMSVTEPGTYEWKLENGVLTFRPIDDSSNGRKSLLSRNAWKPTAE